MDAQLSDYGSWLSALTEQMGFDCNQLGAVFRQTAFYAHLCERYQVEALPETVCFVVFLVQLQTSGEASQVKLSNTTDTRLTPFPAVTEMWKNRYDNYNLWKKPDTVTKWVNLITVGPFIHPSEAHKFHQAWTNQARGLNIKISKANALVEAFNGALSPDSAQFKVRLYTNPTYKDAQFNNYQDEYDALLFRAPAPPSAPPFVLDWSVDGEGGMVTTRSLEKLSDLLPATRAKKRQVRQKK